MIRARMRQLRGRFRLDVTVEFGAGVTALFGPSGSGKTTLLHALLGFEPLDEGEVWWEDELLERAPGGPRVPPERRRFGAVFQDGLLFPHLTVEKNVRFGLPRRPDAGTLRRLDEWMRTLRLHPLRSRYPATLSGGERQRVALARALAVAPRALLLDEPLSGLDAALRLDTLLALRRLRRDLRLPVVYVTHQPAEVLAVADRVVRLRAGRVTWEGEPAGILDDARGVGSDEPANFLEARVEAVTADGSAQLRWGDHRLQGRVAGASVGDSVTALVRPTDVLVAVGSMGPISARNRLQMGIAAVLPASDRVWVRLRAPDPFFAVVTREACRELALRPGKTVTVLVKSLAVTGAVSSRPAGER